MSEVKESEPPKKVNIQIFSILCEDNFTFADRNIEEKKNQILIPMRIQTMYHTSQLKKEKSKN